MDHMLGKGWRDLFDVIITQARKPSFYHQQASRFVLTCSKTVHSPLFFSYFYLIIEHMAGIARERDICVKQETWLGSLASLSSALRASHSLFRVHSKIERL